MPIQINNVPRRVVFAASGTGPYAFTFEILAAGDIAVYKDDTLLTITTDYTVTINTNGTGSITLTAAPTGATQIAIVGNRTIQRTTDFTTGGDFFANTLNDELDQLTIFAQQNAEGLSRALQAPQTDPTTINMTLPRASERAGKYLAFDANGNPQPGDTAVDIGAVAAITDEIIAVAAIDTEVVTVANNIAAVQDALTNANDAAASAELANDWATKTSGTVAGGEYSAKYHAQAAATSASNADASALAAAASAASAASAYDSFDDRYLGTKTADPLLDNDGNALVTGALYYRTTSPIGMKVYDGAQWVAASAASVAALITYEYVATAGQTTFTGTDANSVTLSYTIGSIIVTVNGVVLRPGDDYTASNGTSVVLTNAASLNDKVVIHAFNSFTLADAYTKAQSDAKYLLTAAVGSTVQAYDANLTSVANLGLFRKANPTIVAWSKTGNFTMTTATTIYVEVNGNIKTIASGTSITMPGSPSAGTDYAIWAKTDGTLEATSNHSSPPTANARKVGGFHYAPGGNASGTSGGNTTAQINAYSIWDLKFRPNCSDPRGMTLVAGQFWADIYLCGVDHYTNGTSKYNVTIADGSSLPKISAAFGGTGSNTYAGGTWFSFNEIMRGAGKRLPTYTEACAYAYGTTEASSGGTDPTSTILREAYTSKWGVMLATGNMWQWLDDFIANGSGTGGWQTGLTETRGNIYTYGASARAGVFGGGWGDGSGAGARCSSWGDAPSVSVSGVGARGVCDHLQLD